MGAERILALIFLKTRHFLSTIITHKNNLGIIRKLVKANSQKRLNVFYFSINQRIQS
jgi:hypothetical protein